VTVQEGLAHEYLLGQGFLPIGGESYALYKNYDRGGSRLWEMTATSVSVWGSASRALYKDIRGCLCSAWFTEGIPAYFVVHRPSVPGASLRQIVDLLYDLSREAGLPFLQIGVIDGAFLKEYEEIEGYHVRTEYNEDHSEYAYRPKDILEWSGGINLNKRNRLKKCLAVPDISLRPMTNENIRLCLEVQEAWCRRQDCAYCESFFGCEKKVLEIMTGIFDDRVHRGLFLYHGEEPMGYAICENINEKAVYLHFGKANMPDFFLYLIYMMVKMYFMENKYFNISEDMGNMGLRMFKAHLGAHELWRKYFCTFTKAEQG
jgi:hypothetical protein